MKRLFVDFSLLSRSTKVTGIPRVTYQYFNRFLDISLKRNGDWLVVPVYPQRSGRLVDCLHNLPTTIIAPYIAYLEKMADLHPNSEIETIRKVLAHQIPAYAALANSRVEGLSVYSEGVPLMRRAARAKRSLLARIAAIDPILRKSVNSHYSNNNPFCLSKRPKLPVLNKHSFKSLNRDLIHKPKEKDIVFMPAYWHDIAPMNYFTLQQAGVIIVPMLHDLLPVIIPEKYNEDWSRHFHYNVYATCLLADSVVSISQATKDDLNRLMESHSLPLPEVHVQHHGFDFQGDSNPPPSDRFPKDQPYFLMVGSIEPKKNHSLVIDQMLEVAKTHPGARLKIIGFPGWMHEEITDKIALITEQGGPVDYYKDVDDVELGTAYANAIATIMASSHEGFGLPVIESLSLGCPIILADIPVFREIAGDKGIYFSLDQSETLRSVMEATLENGRNDSQDPFLWPDWNEQANALFEWLISRSARSRPVYNLI